MSRIVEACTEWLLIAGERIARHLYWSCRFLRRQPLFVKAPAIQVCKEDELTSYLRSFGAETSEVIMVHTRIDGVMVETADSRRDTEPNALTRANHLLELLMQLVGNTGTLVMPTNARYQHELGKYPAVKFRYDPKRTPCSVGLVNELFWRRKGVLRSRFPYNMVAAFGPLSEMLLAENLNETVPSPHGNDSAYYRICRLGGLVISIGVPLRDCITIAHVPEEVCGIPIENFFSERTFTVVDDGVERDWRVRLRDDRLARFCYCRKKLGRDLVRNRVIHEGNVGSVRVDWARAEDVFSFLKNNISRAPYPYYGLRLR